MDEDQIVRLLTIMREADSAPILEAMGKLGNDDARRAALVTDRMRVTVAANKTKKTAP